MRGDGPQRGAFALSKAISGPDVFVCSSFRSNAGGTRRALSRTPPTSSTRMCRSDGCHGDLEPSGTSSWPCGPCTRWRASSCHLAVTSP